MGGIAPAGVEGPYLGWASLRVQAPAPLPACTPRETSVALTAKLWWQPRRRFWGCASNIAAHLISKLKTFGFPKGICALVLTAALAQPSAGEHIVYSNLRHTAEHQYGATVSLWRDRATLIGLLEHSAGRPIGDTPAGLIESVAYDLRTSDLSFTARLTEGQHSCNVHSLVPSQDIFYFKGKLTDKSLSGTLTRTDGLHPEKPATVESVSMQRTPPETGAVNITSRRLFEANRNQILAWRGPLTVSGERVFSVDGAIADRTTRAQTGDDQLFISISASGRSANKNETLRTPIPVGAGILLPVSLKASDRDRSKLAVTGNVLGGPIGVALPRKYVWHQNGRFIGEGDQLSLEVSLGSHVFEVRALPASQDVALKDSTPEAVNLLSKPSATAELVVYEEQSWNCLGRLGAACKDGSLGRVPTPSSRFEFACDGVAGRVCVTSKMSVGSIKHDRCCSEELARGNIGMWCNGITSARPNPIAASACEREWEQAEADAARIDGPGAHSLFEHKWSYPPVTENRTPSSGAQGWWLAQARAGAVVGQTRPSEDADFCQSRRVKTIQVRSVLRESLATGLPREISIPVWVCD